MFEHQPKIETAESVEKRAEKILSEQAVQEKFEKILAGREFKEIIKTVDEDGLYTWGIETTDEAGDRVDMDYKRAGVSKSGTVTMSAIHLTLYDSDGFPAGAGTQYNFVNGSWEELP